MKKYCMMLFAMESNIFKSITYITKGGNIMYENEYEEYMRNVLGYPTNNTYMCKSFPYRNSENNQNYESFYPDIYKMLKPMIDKVCENYRNSTLSKEVLEDMATEIYQNIESDINVVGINASVQETESKFARNGMNIATTNEKEEKLTRGCCGNPVLKDLIKILLLNHIINNNTNRPPRPPFNPYPPRPPRPPYRDLDNIGYYDNYYNLNNL
jgi:hypothetical protein